METNAETYAQYIELSTMQAPHWHTREYCKRTRTRLLTNEENSYVCTRRRKHHS